MTGVPTLSAQTKPAIGSAFGLSAALSLLAGLATGVDALDEGLVVFVAWLTCATSAVGVHSTIKPVAARVG